MDSRQSLEFIERLIKEAQTNPAVRRVLKNATLKLAAPQTKIKGIDDAHLENLFEMTISRAGTNMFLKAMERVFTENKGVKKADKTLPVQCHPNFLNGMKKYFTTVVPFQASSLSIETKHWDGSISTKKNDNEVGFYNTIDELVGYLKKIGFSAPFQIENKGKGLVLTFVEHDMDTQILFDNAMADIKQVNDAISEMDTRVEILVDIEEKIEELEREINDKKNELVILEQQQGELDQAFEKLSEEDRKRIEKFYGGPYPEGSGLPPAPEDPDLRQRFKENRDEYRALGKKIKAINSEIYKVKAPLNEAKMRFEELYNGVERGLRVYWKRQNWDGKKQLTEEQLFAFIGLLKTDKYRSLRGNLPYTKTIKVAISCIVKNSSAGYEKATFKHLKNFIKFSVG